MPFLLAVGVAAFSLRGLPAPLGSTLAPEAFQAAPALSELGQIAPRFAQRRPGSASDERLASYVAEQLRGLGGTAGGGFSVRTYSFPAQTIEGRRTLTNVVATRPGSSDASPILILAHRDAAAGPARAELSATTALLELARVFASSETRRTIVLASTSGGSGGSEGAARLGEEIAVRPDAAIVLGDLAGRALARPLVVPFSESAGAAPLLLQRTVRSAVAQELGSEAGTPGVLSQLVHLVFPLSVGEQAVLQSQGIPAVLVQPSGEAGPRPYEPLSGEHMEALGRAVLLAVQALDTAPAVPTGAQSGIVLARQELPAWALSLVILTLILPVAAAGVDGLARMRRRRVATGHWAGWTLSCAAPFFACALLAYLLRALGLLGGAPAAPVPPRALPLGAGAIIVLVLTGMIFALAWLGWTALVRRLGWGTRPDPDAAGLAAALLAVLVAFLAWIANPFAALLIIPALHIFMALCTPQLRPRRALASLALLALAALPLVLVALYYALALHADLPQAAWGTLLLVASGHVGPLSALVWSVGLGCAAASLISILAEGARPAEPAAGGPGELRFMIRGPLSYAGPGSLGGTESALYPRQRVRAG